MTFVNPVKPFKNAVLVFRRNADSAVAYGKYGVFILCSNRYNNVSVFYVIFYRIFTQVVNNFIQKSFNSVHKNTFAFYRKRNFFVGGGSIKVACRFFCHGKKVNTLFWQGNALVKLRKTNNIVHKIYKALRLCAYVSDKARHIFLLYKPVFNKIRTSYNTLERGLKFVRNICGKFPPRFFRIFMLRNIESQNYCAKGTFLRINAAYIKLIGTTILLGTNFAVAVFKCGFYCGIKIAAAVNGKKAFSGTIVSC